MKKYIFLMAYKSHIGQYAKGQILELSAELAAWLMRDAPGCIEVYAPAPPIAPQADRMERTPKRRR